MWFAWILFAACMMASTYGLSMSYVHARREGNVLMARKSMVNALCCVVLTVFVLIMAVQVS